jgi:RNA polymerase sigma factor (TIGR02999 family)
MAESPAISPAAAATKLPCALSAQPREHFDQLFSVVYQELRTLARWQGRRQAPGTLTTTALVHEAYLKLSADPATAWNDKRYFFAVASLAMRQIIIDHARQVLASKRGGAAVHLSIDDIDVSIRERASELVNLDHALTELQVLNPRLAQVVELRFFGGLSVEEAAGVLGESPRTVKRDWRKARAFLFQSISSTREP